PRWQVSQYSFQVCQAECWSKVEDWAVAAAEAEFSAGTATAPRKATPASAMPPSTMPVASAWVRIIVISSHAPTGRMTQMFCPSLHGYKPQVQIAIFVADKFFIGSCCCNLGRKVLFCVSCGARIPIARRRFQIGGGCVERI